MSFSKPSKWKVWFSRLLIISISIFASLLLCEIGVHLIAPQALSGTWSERSPRGGSINKKNWTVRHQLHDRILHYRFNDVHLRGGPLGAGTNRVLVMGDSFTFGWLVEETNTFVTKFNARAAKDFPAGTFEFLNGGTAGWGTADYVAFVEDFAPQIQPAAIVVFANNDDVERTVRAGLFKLDAGDSNSVVPVKPNFAAAGLRDAVRTSRLYQWSLEHVELVQLLRIAFENRVNRVNVQRTADSQAAEDSGSGVQLTKALFLRLQKWCAARHCPLFVLTTGYNAFPDFPLGWDDGTGNRKFFDAAPEFFQQNGFIFHDLGPDMSAATDGDFKSAVIPEDFHPDERGHQLIADLAWSWLKPQLQQTLESRNGGGAAK